MSKTIGSIKQLYFTLAWLGSIGLFIFALIGGNFKEAIAWFNSSWLFLILLDYKLMFALPIPHIIKWKKKKKNPLTNSKNR